MHAPVFVPHDQSRFFEHAQMLRNGGQGHVVRRGELADRRFAKSELREDAATGRVGKRSEGGVERGV
jgi:hypothetical protein